MDNEPDGEIIGFAFWKESSKQRLPYDSWLKDQIGNALVGFISAERFKGFKPVAMPVASKSS